MGIKKIVTLETCAMTGEQLNSPRSIEACRRAGIEPDELLPKTVSEFLVRHTSKASTMVEKEAAVLRQQHYELLRQAKLDEVRKERETIIEEESLGGGNRGRLSPVRSPNGKLLEPKVRSHSARPWLQRGLGITSEEEPTMTGSGSHALLADSTIVQLEEKRLARMKWRQQKEIQNVIEMETRMAKIQQEHARRSAEEARRKEEYQKALKAKRVQTVANKHARELERKKQEDRDAALRKVRAKQEAEREKQLHEQEAHKALERQHEALQREHERNIKAEEFRKQTEALLKHQEDIVAASRARMLEKERHVVAKMELANKRRHQEAVERRDRANARIQYAVQQNQLTLEKKKSEFEEKQASAFDRAHEIQKKTLVELKDRAAQHKKDEEVRQKRLEAARKHRDQEVSQLLAKRSELEAKQEQANEEREKSRLLHTIEKSLTIEEKQQQVERIKRKDEYARLQLLHRITEDDERSRVLKAKKHALMLARKQVALDAMLRKHKIEHAMQQLRRTNKWDKIEETLGTGAVDDARSPRGGNDGSGSFMGRG